MNRNFRWVGDPFYAAKGNELALPPNAQLALRANPMVQMIGQNLPANFGAPPPQAFAPQGYGIPPQAYAIAQRHGVDLQTAMQMLMEAQMFGAVPFAYNGPRNWSNIVGGPGLGAPSSPSVGFPEPLGLGTDILPALAGGVAGVVSLSQNAQKKMVAQRLVATTTESTGGGGTTTENDVFVTSVTIGGRTFTNNGSPIPISAFKNVDSLANFAGCLVETSQSCSITFANYGGAPVRVGATLIGYTGEG